MIIFFYGEDVFRAKEKISEIKNKFLQKIKSGSIPIIIDYEEEKKDLFNFLRTGNLFSEKSLLIVKNLLTKTTPKEQLEIIKNFQKKKTLHEDKNIVIVFWEKKSFKKNETKLFSYLLKNSKSEKFEKLNNLKLLNWIILRFKKYNPHIILNKKNLEKLIAHAGDDLFQLENEIQKLSNYCEKGTLSEKDIEILVKSKIHTDIFKTIDALAQKDKKNALFFLHHHLNQNENPLYLFSMYAYQFRNLFKIGEYYWQGQKNIEQIAKQTKLHPFVIKKCLIQLRNFNFEKLKAIYSEIQKIDWKIKNNQIDAKMALDKFVVGL